MQAGARKRRTHESPQRVSRHRTCSITTWRAAKKRRAKGPRTSGPPGGGVSSSAPVGPRPAACPPLGGAPSGLLPCVGLGLAPPAAGAFPAAGDLGRLGDLPKKRLIIHGQLTSGDFRRPRHPSQRPGPPDPFLDEVLGPPPAPLSPGRSRGCWRIVSPGRGPTKSHQRTRLVREEGVPMARMVPLAGCHAGSEDHQVHAVATAREDFEHKHRTFKAPILGDIASRVGDAQFRGVFGNPVSGRNPPRNPPSWAGRGVPNGVPRQEPPPL